MKLRYCLIVSAMILVNFISSEPAYAGYGGGLLVNRLLVQAGGTVFFGTDSQPDDTCRYFDFDFKFDSTAVGGKQLLGTLLTAKSTNAIIDLWYEATTTPGASYSNCDPSVVNGAALE